MKPEYLYLSVSPTQKDDKNRPLIKIGITKNPIEIRMNSLSRHSGVSSNFKCIFLYECKDCAWLEDQIQFIYQDLRWNPKREFYSVTPESAIKVIKLFEGKVCDLSFLTTPIIKIPRKKQMTVSENKKSKILTLYRKGITQVQISEDTKVTSHHVAKIIKEYKIKNGSISA
jgi:hypothetical protein